MKQIFKIVFLLGLGHFLFAQAQPGLHVDEGHTVVFGKDTTSSGIKLLWYPSKAAFRAGKTNTTEWIYNNVGPFSVAFGNDTEARGNYSSAFGLSTWALSYAETSVGRYSLGGGNLTSWLGTDPLFEVGNGTGTSARANAFTVYKNGNAEFQRSIKLGNHTGAISNGTIRYTGSDIQGRVGGVWRSLTSTGGSSPWSTSGSNIYYNTGGVGINTSSPLAGYKLDVNGFAQIWRLRVNGNTDGSAWGLGVNGNTIIHGTELQLRNSAGTKNIRLTNAGTISDILSDDDLNLATQNGGPISFFGYGRSGGVTIGSNDLPTGYRLSVDGKIASEEVLVQLSQNWPDYVFDKEYELMKLSELDHYIKSNNHLPGIPTAAKLESEGIHIGDMQTKQMEKIEELTLYIIKLEKRITDLELKTSDK